MRFEKTQFALLLIVFFSEAFIPARNASQASKPACSRSDAGGPDLQNIMGGD